MRGVDGPADPPGRGTEEEDDITGPIVAEIRGLLRDIRERTERTVRLIDDYRKKWRERR